MVINPIIFVMIRVVNTIKKAPPSDFPKAKPLLYSDYALYFSMIPATSFAVILPYTSSLTLSTGARPQQPMQRVSRRENFLSGVHSSLSIFKMFLTSFMMSPEPFKDDDRSELRYSIADEYHRRFPYGRQPFYKAKKFFQGPCMKLIHRDIIGDRLFDTRFTNGEDSMFMFLISDRLRYVDFTLGDAVYYRRVRQQSAHSQMHDRKIRFKAAWNKMRMFTGYYFAAPRRYSLRFYLTRLLACVKTIINR